MKRRTRPHPFVNLLLIPGAIVVDICLILLGSLLDTWLFSGSDALGHGFPVFIILAVLASFVFSAAALIAAIVLTVRGFRKRGR